MDRVETSERLVIRLTVTGPHMSGKTHRLARAFQAIKDELELSDDDIFILSGDGSLNDHLNHLVEMKAKDHLDPNAVSYRMAVEHLG